MKITLRAARVNAGLTAAMVGHTVGVDRRTIANWESGKTMPTIQKLNELVDLYGCTVNDIKI